MPKKLDFLGHLQKELPCLSQAMVVGDRRKFLSCILVRLKSISCNKNFFIFQNVRLGLQVQGRPLHRAPHGRAGVGGAAVVQGSREQGAGRSSVLVGLIVFVTINFFCLQATRVSDIVAGKNQTDPAIIDIFRFLDIF